MGAHRHRHRSADVYVETVNPANPNEVQWRGTWEPLRVITEEIRVRGGAPETVTLKFSRHGPIFYEDRAHHRAYALRSALHGPGTAEYLGGIRLDQASSARDCLMAANFMPTPPTNLVCADADGNIAFRIAVFAPVRPGWSGRLPVPGTGAFEWGPRRADSICRRSSIRRAATSRRPTTSRIRRTSRRRTPTSRPIAAIGATSASSR